MGFVGDPESSPRESSGSYCVFDDAIDGRPVQGGDGEEEEGENNKCPHDLCDC